MNTVSLDAVDRRILTALQRDATLSISALAELVGLSTTPCWKRVKRLEDHGVVSARVALVDREKIGLGVTVFVAVRTAAHDEAWLETFANGVRRIPEIVEFYRMSGEVDYLLKVVCADIADYDRIYKQLIRVAKLHDVSSSFAMEQIKYTTEVPIEAVPTRARS
jgi:Lrp/AsnC family transcriptional regulator